MKAILVFIDGTICDAHPRYYLGMGTPEFYRREAMRNDLAVPGSLQCLQEPAQHYSRKWGQWFRSAAELLEQLRNCGFEMSTGNEETLGASRSESK